MTALVDTLREGSVPAEAQDVLAKAGKNKSTALVRATYAKYFEIIDACARIEAREALIREAEDLFTRRKKNSFYSGGLQSRGGGPDNDHTVDYVPVILEWCKRNGGEPVETIHAWRW